MLRKTSTLIVIIMLASIAAITPAKSKPDPISGTWHVVFSIAGQTAEGTYNLKLDGNKVTGTVETAHTGPGIVTNGSWTDGKMSFTLVFEKHESINVTGRANDGTLKGDFATEGMTGTWTATRK